MAIPVGVGGLLGLLPDPGENSNAGFEVTLRNILDQLGAQVVGGVENLIEHGFGTPLEMDGLAAAIRRRASPFDPAVLLQPIEQAGKGRAFDSHSLGDFLLGQFISALREMNERAPFSLAKAERAEPLVEPRAPGARGPEKDEAELVDVGRRHAREMISVLTKSIFPRLSTAPDPGQNDRVIAVISDPLDRFGALRQPSLALH